MDTNNIPIIELAGSPKQRGQIYGESVRSHIAAIVEAFKHNLCRYSENTSAEHQFNPDHYLQVFLNETGYIDVVKNSAPDLYQEVAGIAEGSGQSLTDILALQLADEEWVYGANVGYPRQREKCTGFAILDSQSPTTWAGQNMDIPSWTEGHQVLLRVMPTDSAPEALVFAYAGIIALNGVNAAGVGVTCNTLAALDYSLNAMPVSFTVRRILQQRTIDQAEALIRESRHSCGQNYILSSAHAVRCFECSATSVEAYHPDNHPSRIFHTNHPLTKPAERVAAEKQQQPGASSMARLDSITERLGCGNSQPSLADIKSALAAHDNQSYPVSRQLNKQNLHDVIGYTAGSSIYEFGQHTRLHFAPGPPCSTEYITVDFKNHDTHKSRSSLVKDMQRWNYTVEQKINIGNLDPINTTYADGYTYHGMGGYKGTGTDNMKRSMENLRAGFSDIRITNDIFGEGDRAVNHFHISGTHDGEWAGLAPTGRKISYSGIAISRFKEGQIVEEWEYCDEMTLLNQLGLLDAVHSPRSVLELVKQLAKEIAVINKACIQ